MVLLHVAWTERTRAMKNENTSVGDANIGNVHEHEQCCMSDEQAKIALAIIKQPDQRFVSIGENEQNIAQGVAMFNLVKECSEKGVSGFLDYFEAHVRLVKKNALQDQSRKRTVKSRDKKTGKIEFVPRTVSCDTEINGDGAPTMLETFVAKSSAGTEAIEESERQEEIESFYSKVKASVKDMPFDMRTKQAFLLYMEGMNYVEIARAVYGYSNVETKKIYTNKVSCAVHSVCMKLRAAHGNEAKMILRPVAHVYERYV